MPYHYWPVFSAILTLVGRLLFFPRRRSKPRPKLGAPAIQAHDPGLIRLQQLSQAVEQSPVSVVITNSAGQITYVNPKFTQLTGYTFEEALGQNPSILKSGHTPPEVYAKMWATISSGREWRGEFLNKKKSGELYWELAIISGTRDEQGHIIHYIAVKEDITARKAAEDAERQQRVFAEALRDTAAVLNSTLNPDEVMDRILENVDRVVPHDAADIIRLEPAAEGATPIARFARLRGYHARKDDAGGEEDYALSQQFVVEQIHNWQHMLTTQKPVVVSDVSTSPIWVDLPFWRWIRSYVGAPMTVRGRVIGFLELNSATPGFFTPEHAARLQAFADAAAVAIENARLYAEVEQLSLTDALTGVSNFRGLQLLGQREIEHARRFNRPLSVFFFDIDHFRNFNNRYSHATGNLVLQAVAQCVRKHMRSVDVVARFGGEEFVVLLPETSLAAAYGAAERLRGDIEHHIIETEYGVLSITVSIGVAELTDAMPDLAALIDRANQAEHQAKEGGRNRVKVAPKNDEPV